MRPLSGLFALVLCAATALSADVEEKFPDGKVMRSFRADDQGRKNGPYVENYENGKPKVKAAYAADELDGAYSSFYENGKPQVAATYKKGKLDGAYKEYAETGQLRLTAVYRDGKQHGWRTEYEKDRPVSSQYVKDEEVVLPRSLELTKKGLAELLKPAAGKGQDAEREAALRRLKAYRYLCELPYDDLTLDDEYNKLALAGAKLCEKIGRLDHKPANPGLPQDDYDLGLNGTSHSNLASGLPSLADAVDGWMNDSDAANRDRVGHRRWCLNPAMQKTGFGRSGKFSAMYSMDNARKAPDYDWVAFPPRGVVPAGFFKPTYVWSLTLNPAKYEKPGDGVKVSVYAADKEYSKTGKPLELAYFKVETSGFGVPNCIIFQPKPDRTLAAAGSRYWVEVEGVQTKDGKPAAVHWVTEFAP